MIPITDELSISEDELVFTASRSGGPGGQNVNKVSSRVTLTFDLAHSSALSDIQKRRIFEKLRNRINNEGVLRVVSQRTRSQELNRSEAIARFAELLRDALATEAVRVKTRPTRASREKRLHEKKHQTDIKKERSRKEWTD
jgi:ribosome-associated protein